MKINQLILSFSIVPATSIIVVSCQNNPEQNTHSKLNNSPTTQIKKYFAEFKQTYKNLEAFLIFDTQKQIKINNEFNLFFDEFRNIKKLAKKLKFVSNPVENGQYFLNQSELNAHFDNSQQNIYKKWLSSQNGVKIVNNALGISDDAQIQIKSNSTYLSAKNNSNQIYAFEQYLNSLDNKNFKDDELINNIAKMKQFVSDHIYNEQKWQSDLEDSLLNEQNHSHDNHSHTHSHATINIALNALRQNNEFVDELEKLYSLESNFNALDDNGKKELILNNIFKLNKIDINKYRQIIKNAQLSLTKLREQAIKLFIAIKSIENHIKL
ncbi:hypothetical protein EG856_00850 [Mycoplasmopsis phocirhinis]|uniref:Lipoprotein n=1 Tax=Mycoplasmopsis phocirhinis TaxID=142650 RepID=A0A4P6MLY0_9BACT|nr:hypothetical protein [Mycoplasmopsis phocirhinis]QBF34478.1 hypothetical protein EG856_00850 [Mycoplasmopsis phocirhinis]